MENNWQCLVSAVDYGVLCQAFILVISGILGARQINTCALYTHSSTRTHSLKPLGAV